MLFLIITAVLALYFPINQYFFFDKAKQKMIDDPNQKDKFYKETMIYLWLIAIMLAVLLHLNSIQFKEIGFVLNLDLAFILITILLIAVTLFLYKSGAVDSNNYNKLKNEYDHVRYILPDNRKQFQLVTLTSITAGITEEFIYRAYMFWFFNQYFEWYISIVLLNLIFSLSHLWSGLKNMIGAFSFGLIMSIIYFLSGSILLAMIAHIVIDLHSGRVGLGLKRYEDHYVKDESR